MAKSIVKKIIRRKIRTADFESMDIEVEIEEQIVWETEEERTAATRQVTERLLNDFTEAYNSAVERAGVDRCIGVVSLKGGNNKPKSNNSNGSEVDFDFS